MASKKRDGLYKRGDYWWLRSDPLTGARISTKCRDLEAAKRWRTERERLAANPAHAAAQTAKLSEWINRIIESKRRGGKSDATVGIYGEKLGHCLRVFGVDAMLADINPTTVDAYVTQRRDEGASDHTISIEFQKLKAALKLAKRVGAYAGDLDVLRPPDLHVGYVPKERALTRDEITRLLAQLKPHRAAFVAISVAFGCRLSEAFKITPDIIDLEQNRVFIDGTKTDDAKRWIPILSVFRPLVELAKPHLPLKPWDKLWRDIQNACARAKIAPCSSNDFRRTHATLLKEAGVDSDVVRRLLGHTTTHLVDTVYGRPSTDALAKLAEERLQSAAPIIEAKPVEPVQRRHIPNETATSYYECGMFSSAPDTIRTCDLRFRKTGKAANGAADSRFARCFARVATGEEGRTGTANGTRTSHPSAAALALMYAAERVLTFKRRRGTLTRRKAARRVG